MRLSQPYPYLALEVRCYRPLDTFMNILCQELGRSQLACKLRQIIEILIVQRPDDVLRHLVCDRDIDDDILLIERFGKKGDIDHVSSAMQIPSGSKIRMRERVGDHDVFSDCDSVHVIVLSFALPAVAR